MISCCIRVDNVIRVQVMANARAYTKSFTGAQSGSYADAQYKCSDVLVSTKSDNCYTKILEQQFPYGSLSEMFSK